MRSGKAAFIRMLTRWTRIIVQDDDKRRKSKRMRRTRILFRFPPDFFVDEDSREIPFERREDGRGASVIILNLASSVNTGDNL